MTNPKCYLCGEEYQLGIVSHVCGPSQFIAPKMPKGGAIYKGVAYPFDGSAPIPLPQEPTISEMLKSQSTPDGTSKRYNSGKVQTREIDPAFILGIGEVLTKSRAKYDHFNWCKPTKLSTPYESLMRHLLAFQSGEEFDAETKSHHLLHAATNLMFMYYHITNNPEESDDRFFKKDK